MSKKIYIIRHAKSSWDFPDLNDMVRPLSIRGKNDLNIIALYLKNNNIIPDYVISSPATRALHTAIEICKAIGFDEENIDIQKLIYFSSSEDIKSYLKNMSNQFNTLFLFGHEPILSILIKIFTNQFLEKFPTCAVFGIEFDTNNWKNIDKGNQILYIYPKMI